MTTLLCAENLTVLKGNHVLLRRYGISIAAGEIIYLTGENGSGKTTLLQTLAGLHPYRSGRITRNTTWLYLGHSPGIKASLTPRENLRYAARLYHHMPRQGLEKCVEQALTAVGILSHADRQTRFLSAGQQRRCQLARLWLQTPALWLLDEPLTALDAATGQNLIRHLEQHRAAGGAVIITSHQPLSLPRFRKQEMPSR